MGYVCSRLRSLFFKNDWVCHGWCNFQPGYTCRTTLIFGTPKDDCLLINNLAPNNFQFQPQKRLSKWRQHISKMVKHFFCQKAQNRIKFEPYDTIQILIK